MKIIPVLTIHRVDRCECGIAAVEWLCCILEGMRAGFRLWRSRNHDRAYVGRLRGDELDQLAKDLGRTTAELRAEIAKPVIKVNGRSH